MKRLSFVSLLMLAVPALAAAQSASPLPQLVAEFERNNPELQAARREVDMRAARIAPAGTPPDPTLSVGYMSGFLRPPFFPSSTTPDAFRQVGISQELPYPGKLALRSRIAASDADVARWSYEDVRVRLASELKAEYVEYVRLDRSLEIVRRNKKVLEDFRRIAEARFSVGKAAQADVLKAQVEISILTEQEQMLLRERTATNARVNALLYRPQDTSLESSDAFVVQVPDETLEGLQALAAKRAPAIQRDVQQVTRGEHAVALAKKELYPDFGLNVTTQKFVGMPWMYGVDFMVRVPIFWQRKQRPMIAEATAGRETARQMQNNTRAAVAAAVTDQYAAMTTSRRLLDLYDDSILPQARLALESAMAAYEVGTVDFLTVLSNFTTVLSYEVNLEQQKSQYRQALARLEPLVGLELIR